MPSQSQNQDLAWELEIMGLTGDGARKLFDLTHILPADAKLLRRSNRSPTSTSAARRRSSCGTDRPRHPQGLLRHGFTEAQNDLGNHLQQILNGEKSAQDG